jgi:outer membrane protein OmpA-like peptidoglycan-associated protein
MVRTKKIKNYFYYLSFVLLASSCGNKNYGSIYYAGKTAITIEDLQEDGYSSLNRMLGSALREDTIVYDVMLVPELSKEEIALDNAISEMLQSQKIKEEENSTFGTEVQVKPLFFRDTVSEIAPIISDSAILKVVVPEAISRKDTVQTIVPQPNTVIKVPAKSIVKQDTNVTIARDSSLAMEMSTEPITIRDTVRKIVYDSVRVQHFDTVNQTLSVTTFDTIRKTVVLENQYPPQKQVLPVQKNQAEPVEEVTKKRDQKSTPIVPIIIPTSKKEKTDTTNMTRTLSDSTMQDNDSLVNLLDQNQFLDTNQIVLKDSTVNWSSANEINALQDKIEMLELKMAVDNQIIVAKLDELMRMKLEEMSKDANKKPLAPIIIEKEIELESTKLVFYYLISKKLPENENALIDEIIAFTDKHRRYKITLSGYTDASGSAANNLKLSKERVTKIRGQLIARGIDEKNIFIQYFGEKYAVAENPDAQRKVECTIDLP